MPRKARKFSRSKWKQGVLAPANRPSKRKQWSDQQMRDAIEAASSGTVSVNRAADTYGVPRSINDRLYQLDTPEVSNRKESSQTKATPLGDLSNTVSNPHSNSSGQSSSSGSTISKFLGPLPERTPS